MRIIGKSKRRFIKPKAPKKVYCKNCRWYMHNKDFWPKDDTDHGIYEHQCSHGTVKTSTDTPICQEHKYGNCMELNKCNDCPLFMDSKGQGR